MQDEMYINVRLLVGVIQFAGANGVIIISHRQLLQTMEAPISTEIRKTDCIN